jgi:hypothetical protein
VAGSRGACGDAAPGQHQTNQATLSELRATELSRRCRGPRRSPPAPRSPATIRPGSPFRHLPQEERKRTARRPSFLRPLGVLFRDSATPSVVEVWSLRFSPLWPQSTVSLSRSAASVSPHRRGGGDGRQARGGHRTRNHRMEQPPLRIRDTDRCIDAGRIRVSPTSWWRRRTVHPLTLFVNRLIG